MASKEDDVLSVSINSESEFSGFDTDDLVQPPEVAKNVEIHSEEVPSPEKKKGKSPVKGKKWVKSTVQTEAAVSKSKGTKKKKQTTKSSVTSLNIHTLSKADIQALKEKLGIYEKENMCPGMFLDEDNHNNEFFASRPNLHVQIDRNDISDSDLPGTSKEVSKNFEKELFGSDSDSEFEEWRPPRLKASEKDKPISQSLANLINVACSSQCDIEDIMKKYKIPENVDKACPPMVNNEIWKILDRKVHSQDKYVSDVQNIVAAAIVPVIKLATTMKKSLNQEAKSYVSDILTLIGQVQYNLSVRRRYNIRPHLKKKYHSLCNISMPITTFLFGDDIAKEIKSCDSIANVGREQYSQYKSGWRGRGSERPFHRGSSYSQNYSNFGNRYQPYPQQRGSSSRPFRGKNFRRNPNFSNDSPNDK